MGIEDSLLDTQKQIKALVDSLTYATSAVVDLTRKIDDLSSTTVGKDVTTVKKPKESEIAIENAARDAVSKVEEEDEKPRARRKRSGKISREEISPKPRSYKDEIEEPAEKPARSIKPKYTAKAFVDKIARYIKSLGTLAKTDPAAIQAADMVDYFKKLLEVGTLRDTTDVNKRLQDACERLDIMMDAIEANKDPFKAVKKALTGSVDEFDDESDDESDDAPFTTTIDL